MWGGRRMGEPCKEKRVLRTNCTTPLYYSCKIGLDGKSYVIFIIKIMISTLPLEGVILSKMLLLN